MLNFKSKWLGLTLGGIAVLTGLVSALLAFKGIISVDVVFTISVWCFLLLFIPGFVLHMIAVRNQLKEKQKDKVLR